MGGIGLDPFIEFGFLRRGEDEHTGKEFVAECRTLRRGEREYLLSEVSGHHESQYYAGRRVSSSETINWVLLQRLGESMQSRGVSSGRLSSALTERRRHRALMTPR